MLKVGINGFGRIGRAIFRVNMDKNIFEVVASLLRWGINVICFDALNEPIV